MRVAKKGARKRVVLTGPARRDIRDVLRWSEENFGRDAARRYENLLIQALRDIEADPSRPGVRQRSELPADIFLYHLVSSRDHVLPRVAEPRHFLVYRQTSGLIEILRVLHDRQDLTRHLPVA